MYYRAVHIPSGNNVPVLFDTDLYNRVVQTSSYTIERGGRNASTLSDAIVNSATSLSSDPVFFNALSYIRYNIPHVTGNGGSNISTNLTLCFPHVLFYSLSTIEREVDDWRVPSFTASSQSDNNTASYVANVNRYGGYWYPEYSCVGTSRPYQIYFSESYYSTITVLPNECLNLRTGQLDFSQLTKSSNNNPLYATLSIRYAHYSEGNNDWSWRFLLVAHGVNAAYASDEVAESISEYQEESDPFAPQINGPGGYSGISQGGDGTGGGFGDFDYHSDDVGGSNAPSISASDSGMLTIHVGTIAHMQSLGNYLWSSSFSIDNFKKLLANPMDCIIGCHMIPYFNGLTVSDSTIKIGNLSTGVSFPAASRQFYKFSCGSINISSQSLSHSFMDFLPHLHCYLYLPFVGIVPISTDEVIDHTVTVSYVCDIATGSVIAQVEMDSNLVYNYTGNFAASVPISEGAYNNVLQSALQCTQILTAGFLNATGGVSGMGGGGLGMARSIAQAAYATNDTTNKVIQNVLSTVKPAISRSGSFSGTSGFMANRVPFLIVTAPNLAVPKVQNHYTGYPQYETVPLSSCSGYTQVAAIHLEGFAATEEEKSQIIQMLSDGVVF